MTVPMPTTLITDDTPLPGRTDSLTDEQTAMLKNLWLRLLKLFEQKGEPWQPPHSHGDNNRNNGKGSSSSSSTSKKEQQKKAKQKTLQEYYEEYESEAVWNAFETNLFIGKTSNPAWTSLPVDKAIPMIPGHLLHFTFWNMVKGDNPDAVLLRFLRARKWDDDAAYITIMNTLRWRIYIRVDDVSALGETGMINTLNKLKPGMGQQFYDNVHCNKSVIGGPDKAGRGVCYVNTRFHKKEDQEQEVIKLLTVFVMEVSRMIVHQPVETACIVFNMEGFTLANMDFEFVKFLLHCFESYYPETLGSCIMHKVPWVFSTVWAMISPLLDPVVAAKVRFTKSVKELSEFIDMSVIPPFLAGKESIKVERDASQRLPPPPEGTLKRPQVPEILDYNTMIQEYQSQTLKWAANPLTTTWDQERKEHALQYRHATINAEMYLFGRTSYHDIGLACVQNGRLLLKFMGKAPTLDITDSV